MSSVNTTRRSACRLWYPNSLVPWVFPTLRGESSRLRVMVQDFSSKNAPQLNQQQVNDFMSEHHFQLSVRDVSADSDQTIGQTTQWLDNQKYVE